MIVLIVKGCLLSLHWSLSRATLTSWKPLQGLEWPLCSSSFQVIKLKPSSGVLLLEGVKRRRRRRKKNTTKWNTHTVMAWGVQIICLISWLLAANAERRGLHWIYWNCQHIKDNENRKVWLLNTTATHHLVFKALTGHVLLILLLISSYQFTFRYFRVIESHPLEKIFRNTNNLIVESQRLKKAFKIQSSAHPHHIH